MSEIRIEIDSVAINGWGSSHPSTERLAQMIATELERRLLQHEGMTTLSGDRDARQITVSGSRSKGVANSKLIANEVAGAVLRVLFDDGGGRVEK